MHSLGLALLLASIAPALAQSVQSPSLFAASEIREALTENGIAPEMSVDPRDASELRKLVARQVSSQLLAARPAVSGWDFRYRSLHQEGTVQFGTIVLRYPNSGDASKILTLLNPEPKYFAHSEILVHYSAAKLDNMILIAYSENSGDKRIVEVVDQLPDRFARAATDNHWVWKEQDVTAKKP